MTTTMTTAARSGLALLACAALAACGSPEEPTYEADATDESGGELIVSDADAEGVEVDLPETEMTMVPEGGETPTEGIEIAEEE